MKYTIPVGRFRIAFAVEGDSIPIIVDGEDRVVPIRDPHDILLTIRYVETLEAEAAREDEINELWDWLRDMTSGCGEYCTSRIRKLRELTGWAK